MKLRSSTKLLLCCTALALVSLEAQHATAQVDVEAGPVRVQVGDAADHSRSALVRRASEVTGLVVKNEAGTELGTVEDLVLDLSSGRVRYAALSYGGFLGVGDKLFAVPWDRFQVSVDDDGEEYLVLNIDEETLKNAEGFDQDNWPDVASPEWSRGIDDYYGQGENDLDID